MYSLTAVGLATLVVSCCRIKYATDSDFVFPSARFVRKEVTAVTAVCRTSAAVTCGRYPSGFT